MGVGDNINRRRKELGFSAEYVANRMGVSITTIYRYEKGDIMNMGVDKLEMLAGILQTTPATLMDWDEGNKLSEEEAKAKRWVEKESVHIERLLDAIDSDNMSSILSSLQELIAHHKNK